MPRHNCKYNECTLDHLHSSGPCHMVASDSWLSAPLMTSHRILKITIPWINDEPHEATSDAGQEASQHASSSCVHQFPLVSGHFFVLTSKGHHGSNGTQHFLRYRSGLAISGHFLLRQGRLWPRNDPCNQILRLESYQIGEQKVSNFNIFWTKKFILVTLQTDFKLIFDFLKTFLMQTKELFLATFRAKIGLK